MEGKLESEINIIREIMMDKFIKYKKKEVEEKERKKTSRKKRRME